MWRVYFLGARPASRFWEYSTRSEFWWSSAGFGALLEKARTLLVAPPEKRLAASSFLYSSLAGEAFTSAFSGSLSRVSSKLETFRSIADRFGMKRSPCTRLDERFAEEHGFLAPVRLLGVPIRQSKHDSSSAWFVCAIFYLAFLAFVLSAQTRERLSAFASGTQSVPGAAAVRRAGRGRG